MFPLRHFLFLAIFVIFLSSSFLVPSVVCQSSSKVLLHNVDSLVFSQHSKTTARRSSPIPQMHCTSGPCHDSPSSIFCKNVGAGDNNDVNWECKATLPSGITLGRVEVSCEGYDYPEDPYILKGSCGLEYALKGSASSSYHYDHSSNYYPSSSSSSSFLPTVFSLLFFGFIFYLICRVCAGARHSSNFRGGGAAPWGPGGNPPPYGGGVYDGSTYSSASCAPPGAQQGPGFWTGAGLGGLGGYLLGRNRNGYGMRYGNGYGYGGGYGGGFGGGYRPAPTSASGGSSSSSSSYGGTRRR